MAVKTSRVSELAETTETAGSDLLSISQDQGDGSYLSKKVTISTFKKSNVANVTSDYTVTTNDDYLICDGSFNIYLFNASGSGKIINIKNIGNNRISVVPYQSDKIGGNNRVFYINELHAISIIDATNGRWELIFNNT